MFVKIEADGVLYQQLYHALRRAILSGALAPGTRLPSTRAFAHELGVSRNTVLLAYDQLLAEGYAVGQTGSGTYVASTLPDVMSAPPQPLEATRDTAAAPLPQLSAYGKRLMDSAPPTAPSLVQHAHTIRYDFRYGVPAVQEFPHAIWRRLLARRARAVSLGSLHYGPPEGYGPLRQAIADYLRRARGVVCDAQQVIVVNGSQQALDLTARVLLETGDGVVIEEPHYQGARQVFLAAGARLLTVPVDAEGLQVAALPDATAGVRLAYVTPSHQFPSGAIMSLARRLGLLAWAERVGAYIVEDDYDSEFRYAGRPVAALQGLDRSGRVIYVGTFSKVLFPALRLGYVVLPAALVHAYTAAKWLADRHTSSFEQEVLTDFICEGHFERYLRRSRTRNAMRREALLEALAAHLGRRVEVSGANAGMHLLVWLRDLALPALEALIAQAAQAEVGLYSITPYYLAPPPQAGLLLGYTAMTPGAIRTGIRRLATLLD